MLIQLECIQVTVEGQSRSQCKAHGHRMKQQQHKWLAQSAREYAAVQPITIIRLHHTYYVDAAYCYRPSSVVCRSVCLLLTVVSPAKTA